MPSPELDALLRVAVEVFYRSHCVARHLDEVRSFPAPEYHQLAEVLQGKLRDVSQPVVEAIESAHEVGGEEICRPLLIALSRFSRWFSVLHEGLVYLPLPSVLPETCGVFRKAFGATYTDLEPSIILGTLFNAFHFDFYENLGRILPDFREISPFEGRKPVLQQPVCDRRSPAGWAVLAHEMGHAIDRKEQISATAIATFWPDADPTNTTYKIVSKWAKELCADLLAAEACGPAAILALLSIEYSVYPLHRVYAWTKTHPATLWRLKIVSDYLRDKYSVDFLHEDRERYSVGWDYSVSRAYPDLTERERFLEQNKLVFSEFVVPVSTTLIDKIRSTLNYSHNIEQQSVRRCLLRLENGLPIGAQGATREDLRNLIKRYRDPERSFPSEDQRARAFGELVGKFREDPLPVPTLLLSCAKRRESVLRDATDRMLDNAESAIGWLQAKIDKSDELAVKSIGAAMVHEYVTV